MEVLTQSKYRGFRGCSRYFYHRYEQKLVPRAGKTGLRRGGAFGSALFAVQQAEENGRLDEMRTLEALSDRMSIRVVVEQTLEAIYNEIEIDSQENYDVLDLERVKVQEMAIAYVGRYGIDRRREVVYDLPLINPITGRQSRTFRRAGKIDGVVATGNNHAIVVEDKFTGQIQKVRIDMLPLDTQTTEYVDALAHHGWTAEVQYRHTRYPGIGLLAAKEYKTKPNYPGESLDEFADRLQVDVQDRPDFYFDQQVLFFSATALEEHRHERWRTAQDIQRARADLRRLPLAQSFPRNRDNCERYGQCEFIPLCSRLEDAEHLYVVEELDSPELGR